MGRACDLRWHDGRGRTGTGGYRAPLATIAILGASGTAGDGILEAALADPEVGTIRVITRRITSRMEEGIAAGKVEATIHRDYLDYADVREQLAGVDAVFLGDRLELHRR